MNFLISLIVSDAEASRTFKLAAEYFTQAGNNLEAQQNYRNSAKSMKISSPIDAVPLFEIVIQSLMNAGRFNMAANLYLQIAQIYEGEGMQTNAIDYYNEASSCYLSDGSLSLANCTLLKVADISANLDNFKQSVNIFEQVAKASADNTLTKWSITRYLMKAALCQMAIDAKLGNMMNLRKCINEWKQLYPLFDNTREMRFIEDCIFAFEEGDTAKFSDIVFAFDAISRIDQWKTRILLIVKKLIDEHEIDFR